MSEIKRRCELFNERERLMHRLDQVNNAIKQLNNGAYQKEDTSLWDKLNIKLAKIRNK